MPTRTFIVGTRGSRLALRQTEIVLGLLRQQNPDATFETCAIKTEGDTSSASLSEIGGRGVFVIEIERALLSRDIDIAVHSLKDLPAEETDGLAIAATPTREDVRDALVSRAGNLLADLPTGATIGTGSARRATQLLALRPDVEVRDIRGNVDTRIRKVEGGQYDAAVLAVAGLKRLELMASATQIFDLSDILPAVGQGALAIQVRTDDHDAIRLVSPIDDAATRCAVIAERAFERRLGAGCMAAIAALGTLERRGALRLRGLVGQPRGRIVRSEMESPPAEAEMLGVRLAEFLIAQGAEELLEASS